MVGDVLKEQIEIDLQRLRREIAGKMQEAALIERGTAVSCGAKSAAP
jgi:hypothetical protein